MKMFFKTLTWRTVGAVEMLAIGWFTTGKMTGGLALAAATFVYKGVLYWGHEVAWERFAKAPA